MKPTQEELAANLYDSLLTYEDAFTVLDGKVRTIFNRQVGAIEALNREVKEMRKILEDISSNGIAVEEATHADLCEFIATIKEKVDKGLALE